MADNDSEPCRNSEIGTAWGAGCSRWYNIEEIDGHLRLEPRSVNCPISCHPIEDAVVTCDGQLYDRSQIEKWFKARAKKKLPITSPCTGCELKSKVRFPCEMFKAAFQSFISESGFEERWRRLRAGEEAAREALAIAEKQKVDMGDEIRQLNKAIQSLRCENLALRQQMKELRNMQAAARLRQVETRTHRALTSFFMDLGASEGPKKRKAAEALCSDEAEVIEISEAPVPVATPLRARAALEGNRAPPTAIAATTPASRAIPSAANFNLGPNSPLCPMGGPVGTVVARPMTAGARRSDLNSLGLSIGSFHGIAPAPRDRDGGGGVGFGVGGGGVGGGGDDKNRLGALPSQRLLTFAPLDFQPGPAPRGGRRFPHGKPTPTTINLEDPVQLTAPSEEDHLVEINECD